LIVASSAKASISEGFQSDNLLGVAAAVTALNLQPNNSKYVASIVGTAATGVITVTYIGTAIGRPVNETLVLTPGVVTGAAGVPAVALANGLAGAIDWACGSISTTKAVTVVAGAGAGTLPAKYAPSECR